MGHLPLWESLGAALFAAIFLFGGKLRVASPATQAKWVSVGAGIAVAYAFGHILPELSESQSYFSEAARRRVPFLEFHVYLAALLGFLVYSGSEYWTAEEQQAAGGVKGYGLRVGAYAA